MSTLIRWDPFRVQWNPLKERDELESRLSTLLGHRASTGNGGREALTVAEWSPLVDIVEDENEYRIKAELPAMKKADVRLTVDNGVLTISGERKYEQEEKQAAQAALLRDIAARGYACIPGVGEDPGGQWCGEDSVLAPAMGLAEAMLIADSYRQNALVWAGPDARAQLILLR